MFISKKFFLIGAYSLSCLLFTINVMACPSAFKKEGDHLVSYYAGTIWESLPTEARATFDIGEFGHVITYGNASVVSTSQDKKVVIVKGVTCIYNNDDYAPIEVFPKTREAQFRLESVSAWQPSNTARCVTEDNGCRLLPIN